MWYTPAERNHFTDVLIMTVTNQVLKGISSEAIVKIIVYEAQKRDVTDRQVIKNIVIQIIKIPKNLEMMIEDITMKIVEEINTGDPNTEIGTKGILEVTGQKTVIGTNVHHIKKTKTVRGLDQDQKIVLHYLPDH